MPAAVQNASSGGSAAPGSSAGRSAVRSHSAALPQFPSPALDEPVERGPGLGSAAYCLGRLSA